MVQSQDGLARGGGDTAVIPICQAVFPVHPFPIYKIIDLFPSPVLQGLLPARSCYIANAVQSPLKEGMMAGGADAAQRLE